MSNEDWAHIERIYHSVLLHKPGERAAFLDQACSSSPSLRREVETLLTAHDQSDNFMEDSAFDLGMKALAAEEVISTGQDVGPYKILSTLGRGGMGDVYLAYDKRLERKV